MKSRQPGSLCPSGSEGQRRRFFSIQRVTFAEACRGHLAWLILGAATALMPVLLHYAHIRPGPGCLFKFLTGLPCVFCGYTRAFSTLGRWRWRHAFEIAPLAFPLFLIAWSILLVNLGALVLRVRIAAGAVWHKRLVQLTLAALGITLLLIDWSCRIIAGI